jgi:sialate O-acetylesterase
MRSRNIMLLAAFALAVFAWPGLSLARAANKPPQVTPMMQATGGVADSQVLPRDENDKAAAHVTGLCYPLSGAVEARLCDRGAPMQGLDWAKAGQATEGKWMADLANLPTGGPYDLEVRLLDAKGQPLAQTAVREILVGDLWILAGQSNMQGVGKVSQLPPPIAPVHMFSMDDRWQLGREPLHALLESRDEAHWKPFVQKGKTIEEIRPGWSVAARSPKAQSVGPGLPFAWELYRLSGVPIALIPCALGGTSLEQWSPAKKGEGGKSLYGAMLRRAAAAGGRIRGVVWYQGESDTGSAETAGTYLDRFVDFVAAVRSDLGNPDLCFLYVQLGRFIIASPTEPNWDTVREAQRLAEPKLGRAAVVPAVDGTMVDIIHLDTAGQVKVGRRLALEAAREVFGQKLLRGPRLAEVKVASPGLLAVRFTDVNGRLRAEGRPLGFSFDTAKEPGKPATDPAGKPLAIIVRLDLPQDKPDTVEVHFWDKLPEGARLWYGRGFDPSANLTDDQDMGVLAFGPVAIPLSGG